MNLIRIAACVAALAAVPSLSAGNCSLTDTGKPDVIAHRGHWSVAGSAQNSLRSLAKADSVGCQGSEFDVWITSDGELVVNHDRRFREIVIEESPASVVTSVMLDNGETLPTLDSYLEAGRNTSLRLVCEVKDHSDAGRDVAAAEGVLEMVRKKGLEDRVEYITFSRAAMETLIKGAPEGTEVYYLKGELSPEELEALGSAGMDYALDVLKANPEWIERAHALGQKVNVWTVDHEPGFEWCVGHGVDMITTNRPEELMRFLKSIKTDDCKYNEI